MSDQVHGTLVLGLGNPIMGDDGFGLAVLERLRTEWLVPVEVSLVDGGTWGMRLLPIIEAAERVLLLDSIDMGIESGAPVVLERSESPRRFGHKLSPHQVDLCEILALAELRDTLPGDVVAMGAQPERVELGDGLTPALAASVDTVVALAVARLEVWGHRCSRATEVASA